MTNGAIRRAIKFVLAGGVSCALLIPSVVTASLLYPSDRDYLTPGEMIRLPAGGVPAEALAAELDGIDVTAHLSVAGGVAVITPIETLAVGEHQVALYELTDDDIRALHTTTFTVARAVAPGAEPARAGSGHFAFKGSGSVNASYLVDEEGTGADDERWGADGGMGVEAEFERGPWAGGLEADFLLNTRELDTDLGGTALFADDEQRTFDLGEYLLNVRRGNVSGRLGHHDLRHDSLVLSNFHRRGFSMQWQAVNERLDVTGFGFRTTADSGFDNITGLSRENDRVLGGVLTLRPFDVGEGASEFHVAWLEGDSRPQDSASVIGDDFDSAGEAWSVAGVTRLLDERVELHGEYAQSDFDFDGDGEEQAIEDEAWQVTALYQPIRPDPASAVFQSLELGVDYRFVGTFFRSLANPALPQDLERYRAFANYFRQGLSFNALVERQSDNTNDLEVLPRIRTDLASLTLSYTPSANIEDQPAWLGLPSVSASWTQSHQEQVKDAAALETDADLETRQASVAATFLHEEWDWYLAFSDGLIEDNTERVSDSSDFTTEIGVNLEQWDRARFGLRYQRVRIEEEDTDIVSDEDLAILDAAIDLIPRRLELGFSTTYSRRESQDVTENRSLTTDASVTWIAREPSGRLPGVALWVRGQHRDESGAFLDADDDETTWQVMTGLTIDFDVR